MRAARLLAVAAAVTVAAAGCATPGFRDGPNDAITILTHYGNDPLKSGLQAMVDEWNSLHPDKPVETQAVSYEELLSTITVRQTGGEPPDIVQAYSLWGGQLAAADVLAEPPPDIVADVEANFSPAAVGSVTIDDQVVGYPTEVQTYALFYNEQLLADAGYTEPPATWDELEEIAAATTTTDATGNIDVAGFGLSAGWDSAVVHPFAAFLQAAGGEYMSADEQSAAFDSPEGQAALELQKRLIDKRVADPAIDVLQSFPSQRAAMTVNAGWWIGSLQSMMGDDYDNIGVAPIPGPQVGDRGSLAYGYFTGVNSQSRHTDEAWEFLRWLNAEPGESGATRMGEFQYSLGTIPGRTADIDALLGTVDDPNFAPFIEALDYALPEPNPQGGQEMKVALQAAIESVWSGGQPVEEALTQAAAQADGILDRR